MTLIAVDHHPVLYWWTHCTITEQIRQVQYVDVTQTCRCFLFRAKNSVIERVGAIQRAWIVSRGAFPGPPRGISRQAIRDVEARRRRIPQQDGSKAGGIQCLEGLARALTPRCIRTVQAR